MTSKTPTLETDRLILRPVRLDDAGRIQQEFARWEIVEHMGAQIPWPYPDDGARRFLSEIALPAMSSGHEHHWAITERHALGDAPIGVITLSLRDDRNNRGFWLAKAYQGRGLMKEAVRAVNDFAFEVLGLESIVLTGAEVNHGSRRLKELSGAHVIERYLADHVGGQEPAERWLLTAQTWRANRHRFDPVLKLGLGVAAAIVRDGKLLLGRRIGRHGNGLWQTPGGKPDPGETLEATAVRETFEECGLALEDVREIARQWDDFPEIGYRYETVFFIARANGDPVNAEPDKCHGWEWIPLDALPPETERFAIDESTIEAIRRASEAEPERA